MKKLQLITLLLGILTASSSLAQTEKSDFIVFSQNAQMTSYSLKVNSEHYDTGNKVDGFPIFGGIFKEETINNKIDFYKLYVSKKDCFNGYGMLHRFQLNGQFATSVEFVFNGGNSASSIAWMLCRMGYPNTSQKQNN